MAFGIFKPDQGYWTRMMSTVIVGIISLGGAGWLWQKLSVVNVEQPVYYQAGASLIFMGIIAYLVYYVYWKNRTTVEFFIATEGEMKKVNWSTRREIIGSTWVVIIIAALIAIILFTVDVMFSEFFKMTHVLYGESSIVRIFNDLFGSG